MNRMRDAKCSIHPNLKAHLIRVFSNILPRACRLLAVLADSSPEEPCLEILFATLTSASIFCESPMPSRAHPTRLT
jgi:hypothetical protein